jgi:hypothetical protein
MESCIFCYVTTLCPRRQEWNIEEIVKERESRNEEREGRE